MAAAVFLAMSSACGVIPSGADGRLDESEARALKAGVEANLDESFGAAVRATRGTAADDGRYLRQRACSDSPTDEISLRASAAFRVEGSSVDEVKVAVAREWRSKGWEVETSAPPDEVGFSAGDGPAAHFGSATVSSFVDEQGTSAVGVVIRTQSVCVRLPESLEREAWPTKTDWP